MHGLGFAWLAKVVIAVVLVLAVAGCSTIQTRVDENRALFETFDEETQQNLLNGRVVLGYTMPMTYMAVGSPDEVVRTEDTSGETITWIYQYAEPTYGYGGAFYYQSRFHHGYGYYGYDPFFYYYEPYTYVVRDYLRVVFISGRIARIEELQ